MTAVVIATRQCPVPAELEQEILMRIDRAGLHVCEVELRYKLRWDEREHGSLLDLLDELERQGLIESALQFRLTEHGRAQLPRRLRATVALRQRDPMGGAAMSAGDVQVRLSMLARVVGELDRGGAGRPTDIARRLGPDWSEDTVVAALVELFSGGVVGRNDEVGLWWVA
jgi:DNA-binding PadR family transcriptional regulator